MTTMNDSMKAIARDLLVFKDKAREAEDQLFMQNLRDDQLRDECLRRWPDGAHAWIAKAEAERDEWRRRAEAAEAELAKPVPVYELYHRVERLPVVRLSDEQWPDPLDLLAEDA